MVHVLNSPKEKKSITVLRFDIGQGLLKNSSGYFLLTCFQTEYLPCEFHVQELCPKETLGCFYVALWKSLMKCV